MLAGVLAGVLIGVGERRGRRAGGLAGRNRAAALFAGVAGESTEPDAAEEAFGGAELVVTGAAVTGGVVLASPDGGSLVAASGELPSPLGPGHASANNNPPTAIAPAARATLRLARRVCTVP